LSDLQTSSQDLDIRASEEETGTSSQRLQHEARSVHREETTVQAAGSFDQLIFPTLEEIYQRI
jgi:hypothetical protein